MRTTLRTLVLVGALPLAATGFASGTVFAGNPGSSAHVSGPKTVAYGATYTITVSGRAAGAANELVVFEGGSPSRAISCFSSFSNELHAYGEVELSQQYTVRGSFTQRFAFIANHKGPKGFCAYVIKTGSAATTFAHATASWTVS
jgi:hypothetical protein